MSGAGALAITRLLLGEAEFTPEAGRVLLKKIRDPVTNELVDRALVTYFRAPHSFTGEDVVEISCHGSPLVLRRVTDIVLKLDGRLAGPGEFSLRALSNRKLNLSQAEAIRDLINAQTDAAANQAIRQMNGEVSHRVRPIKERLVRLIVPLESALEFVEDDLPAIQLEEMKRELVDILCEVTRLAATFQAGHLLRDGVKVTIVGRPNVGKSSLFNRLLGIDRAIVTEIPGTTRDTVQEQIALNGIPVLLTDTAGVRKSNDPIEMMGVERTRRAMAEADLLIVVVDGTAKLSAEDFEFLERTSEGKRVIALNKEDLPGFEDPFVGKVNGGENVFPVAAKTGAGFEELHQAILEAFGVSYGSGDQLLITDARHYDLLCRTDAELERALKLLSERASEEFSLAHLYNGLRLLGEITGETTTEDILAEIFSTFCIGK